jgi:two-component system sensor histidine kinase YesM
MRQRGAGMTATEKRQIRHTTGSLHRSIQRIYTVLFLIAGFALLAFFTFRYYREYRQQTDAHLQDTSDLSYTNVMNRSNSLTQLSIAIIADNVVKENLNAINADTTENKLHRQSEIQTYEANISRQIQADVLNVDGIISARIYSLQDDEIFIGTTNREYLDYPMTSDEIYRANGAALWGIAGDTHYLCMARAILSTDTIKPIGYMVIICKYAFMADALPSEVGDYAARSYLIEKNGTVIASTEEGTVGKNVNQLLSDDEVPEKQSSESESDVIQKNDQLSLVKLAAIGEKGGIIRDLSSGEESYYRVRSGGNEDWTLLTTVSTSQPRHTIFLAFLTFTCVVLAAFIGSNIVTGIAINRIMRPTERLLEGMNEFGQGKLDTRVEVTGNDEIAAITRAYNGMADSVQELHKKVYDLELANKEAEIEFLKMQINPHFLYNSLDVISWMGFSVGSNEITDMAVSLADILRASIKQQAIIKIEDELKVVESYLRVQHYRFGDRMTAEFDIPEDVKQYEMPGFLLQPLIENSIIHGLEALVDRQGIVKISIHQEGEWLQFAVSDNGVGMSSERVDELLEQCRDMTQKNAIGVRNVYRRLYILYGKECRFTIESEPDKGTRISFRIRIR